MAASEVEFRADSIDFTQPRVDTLKQIHRGRGMDKDRVRLLGRAGSELEILKRGQQ